jgi:hypothetical protein
MKCVYALIKLKKPSKTVSTIRVYAATVHYIREFSNKVLWHNRFYNRNATDEGVLRDSKSGHGC